MKVLRYHPFLIKPNNIELGEIFDVTLNTQEEVLPYAHKLQELGARNILVSMAGQGAVLLDENGKEYRLPAPKGNVINSVGAGDSMVAGFISGCIESNYDYEYAIFKKVCAVAVPALFQKTFVPKKK